MFQKGYTPYNKGKGKRINAELFCEGYTKWIKRELTLEGYAEYVGVSTPTLKKHLTSLLTDGIVQSCFFTNDMPVTVPGYVAPETKNSEQGPEKNNETAKKTERTNTGEVEYPKLI